MHEGGGLQGMARGFVRHLGSGQLAQLLIDQRQQFVGGLGIAVLDSLKNVSNVANKANLILLPVIDKTREFPASLQKDCKRDLRAPGQLFRMAA